MRITRQKFYSFLGLLFISLFAHAQIAFSQTLITQLNKDSIIVGDPIEWSWELSLPGDFSVTDWPNVPDTIGKIHVLNKSNIDTIYKDGQKTFKQVFTISGYDSFDTSLPILKASAINQSANDTIKITAESAQIIKVRLVDVDINDTFKPIKEIDISDDPNEDAVLYNFVQNNKHTLFILSIIFGLLIIAYAIYCLVKGLRSKTSTELPYEKVMRKLNELESKQLWEKGEFKLYYSELSVLLKDYVKDTLHIQTDKLTSTELVRAFKKEKDLRGLHKPLRDILFTADITKFAKGVPQEEFKLKAIQDTETIITTIEQIKLTEANHDK